MDHRANHDARVFMSSPFVSLAGCLLFAFAVSGCTPASEPPNDAATGAATRPSEPRKTEFDWSGLEREAVALNEAGDYRGAVERLTPHIAEVQRQLDKRPAALADFMETVGDLQRDLQDYDAAERAYQSALQLRERRFGAKSVKVALTWNELGQLSTDADRTEEAATRLERALSLIEAVPDADRGEVALIQHNLGGARYLQDRNADARKLWERALATRIELYGEKSGPVATTLYNLAMLTDYERDPVKAEALFRRALAAYVADKGEHHPDVELTRYALAGLLLDQDKAADALPLLESVLPAYERAYGPQHAMVREVLQRLQDANAALGRDAQVEAWQARLDAFDAAPAPESTSGHTPKS
jgi:hypothetical protein